MKNKELKELNFNNYNQISQLMCKLGCFTFSERDIDHDEINVGNMLRRLLEGYATFNYKVDVSNLFNSPEVMEMIKGNRQEYYSDKMYRLLLHGESHLRDQTKSGHTLIISPLLEEKKKGYNERRIFIFIRIRLLFCKKTFSPN